MLGLELVRHTKSTQKVGTPNPFDWPLSGTYMQVVEIISLLNADQSNNQNIILCASIFETEQYHPAVICLCLCLHVCVCVYNRTVKINHQIHLVILHFFFHCFWKIILYKPAKPQCSKFLSSQTPLTPNPLFLKGNPTIPSSLYTLFHQKVHEKKQCNKMQ